MTKQSQKDMPAGYVRTSTLYMVSVAALILGLFLGNLITTLYAAPQETARRQVAAPSEQQTSQDTNTALHSHILELEKQLLTDPNNIDSWTHLGNLYFDSQQYKPAIRAYTKSLELEPNNANVWTDLGVMYRGDQQYEKALDAFAHAITLSPQHEVARFNSGIVLYFDLNKHQEGLAQWRDLISITPQAKAPNGVLVSDMVKDLETK